MMRRGPLDRYPVEWVLRQAASTRVSGCIEFHGPEPMTVYLEGGLVTAAVAGIASKDPGVGERACSFSDERAARHAAVSVLSARLNGRVGWYYHDPLEDGAVAPWGWGVTALLLDARTHRRDDGPLARWAGQDIELRPVIEPLCLSPDAWSVVVALADTMPADELRVRLGWEGHRLAAALEQLDRSGVLPLPGTRPVLDLTMFTG